MKNNKHAGATTDTLSGAKCMYFAIRVNSNVYGVVGIEMNNDTFDSFESSVLLSILGECALAMENEQNAKEKEAAAIVAKNEQLRANLLRAISHDLRTPLTSIMGNADNLLSNGASFDEETKHLIYKDIYDDSMWLINQELHSFIGSHLSLLTNGANRDNSLIGNRWIIKSHNTVIIKRCTVFARVSFGIKITFF